MGVNVDSLITRATVARSVEQVRRMVVAQQEAEVGLRGAFADRHREEAAELQRAAIQLATLATTTRFELAVHRVQAYAEQLKDDMGELDAHEWTSSCCISSCGT